MAGIVADAGKCTNCSICELICSFTKNQTFNPAKAHIKVIPLDYLGFSNPVTCIQCKNPKCVELCPEGALSQTETGMIELDEEKCNGCRICIDECIIGAVNFDEKRNLPLICDLCGGKPACVEWCPAGALSFESVPAKRKEREEIAIESGTAKRKEREEIAIESGTAKRKGRKEITYTASKAKPFLKKCGLPEEALDWYRKFA